MTPDRPSESRGKRDEYEAAMEAGKDYEKDHIYNLSDGNDSLLKGLNIDEVIQKADEYANGDPSKRSGFLIGFLKQLKESLPSPEGHEDNRRHAQELTDLLEKMERKAQERLQESEQQERAPMPVIFGARKKEAQKKEDMDIDKLLRDVLGAYAEKFGRESAAFYTISLLAQERGGAMRRVFEDVKAGKTQKTPKTEKPNTIPLKSKEEEKEKEKPSKEEKKPENKKEDKKAA